jgi:hypothetical protein
MLTLEQIKPIHPSTLIPKMTTVEENKTEHQPEGDTKGLGCYGYGALSNISGIP